MEQSLLPDERLPLKYERDVLGDLPPNSELDAPTPKFMG